MLDEEKELKKFNWAAAYLGLIWSAVHKCFKKWFFESLLVCIGSMVILYLIIFIINLIHLNFMLSFAGGFIIPFITFAIVFVYAGIKGNRWAWEALEEKDIEKYVKSQKTWNLISIILFSISVLSIILQLGAIILLFKGIDNLPQQEEVKTYISQKDCSKMTTVIPKAIKSVPEKDENDWLYSLGEQLEKDTKTISSSFGKSFNNTLDVVIKQSEDDYWGKEITFDVVRITPCSLDEKNCYFKAPTTDENTSCQFFFDDSGNLELSNKTKTFINK